MPPRLQRVLPLVLALGCGLAPAADAADISIPTDGTPVRIAVDPHRQPPGQALVFDGPLAGWLGTDRVPDVREPGIAAEAILRRELGDGGYARLQAALAQSAPLTPAQETLCRDGAAALWAWVASNVTVTRAEEIAKAVPLGHFLLDGYDPALQEMNGLGPFGASMRKFAYGLCGSQSYQLVALAQAVGYDARVRTLVGGGEFHATTEIAWNGGWHLFDPSLRFYVRVDADRRVPPIEEVSAQPRLVARVRDANGAAPLAPQSADAHAAYYEMALSGAGPIPAEDPAPALVIPAGARLTLWSDSRGMQALKWGPAFVGAGEYVAPVDGTTMPAEYLVWSRHVERSVAADAVHLRSAFGRTGTVVYSVPTPYAVHSGLLRLDADVPDGAEVRVAVSTTVHAAQRVAQFGTLDAARGDWRFVQEHDAWVMERLRGGYGFAYRWLGYEGNPGKTHAAFFPTFAREHVATPLLASPDWQEAVADRDADGARVFRFTGANAVRWPLAVRVQIAGARGREVVMRKLTLEARVQHAPQMQPFARGGAQTWYWTPEPAQPGDAGRVRLTWPEPEAPALPLCVTWRTTERAAADGSGFVRATALVRDAEGRPVQGYVARPHSSRPKSDRCLPFPRSPLPAGSTPAGMYLDATDEQGKLVVHVFSGAPGRSRLWLADASGRPIAGDTVVTFVPDDVF